MAVGGDGGDEHTHCFIVSAPFSPRSLCRRWGKTKLLQHTQLVLDDPRLDRLAALKAQKRDAWHGKLLAGRGHAQRRSLMCCTHRPAEHDPVPLRDDVLKREVQIRKSRQKHSDSLSDALDPTWRAWRKRAIDDIGSDECIDSGHILVVEHFLIETTRECLVVFG